MHIAEYLTRLTSQLDIPFIFNASFNKAIRTSVDSYCGPRNIFAAMGILKDIKDGLGVPIISDVYDVDQVIQISNGFDDVIDVLQIPASLCKQTDLLLAAVETGKVLNIKKGQSLAPEDMKHVVIEAKSTGNENIMVCERGASFGYNNLVSDMTSLVIMRDTECPVIFDATHSVGANCKSGELALHLAKAAAAVGVSGVSMATHPDPKNAWSDGSNSIPMHKMEDILKQLKAIDELTKSF
jgi:2-dehydro-3-deoxyphosphooctonate aldolase (KDO 8-P synthase)